MFKIMQTLRSSSVAEAVSVATLFAAWRKLGNKVSKPFDVAFKGQLDAATVAQVMDELEAEHPLFRRQGEVVRRCGNHVQAIMVAVKQIPDSELGADLYRAFVELFISQHRDAYEYRNLDSLSDLLFSILKRNGARSVYIPGCNTFGWLNSTMDYTTDSPNPGDAFWAVSWSVFCQGKIAHSQRNFLFGALQTGSNHLPAQFDAVLTFPPIGTKVSPEELKEEKTGLFLDLSLQRSMTGDMLAWKMALAHAPTAIVICPDGVLTRSGYEEALRREFIENGQVRAVIHLPGNLLDNTAIPLNLVILERDGLGSGKGQVLFMDVTTECTLVKRRNQITPEHVVEVLRMFDEGTPVSGKANTTSIEELRSNAYSLVPSRYIVDEQTEQVHAALQRFPIVTMADIAELINPQTGAGKSETGAVVKEVRVPDFPDSGVLNATTSEGWKECQLDLGSSRMQRYLLQKGDILIATKGQIGKVALVDDLGECQATVSQTCHIIRLPAKYQALGYVHTLFMFLRSELGQSQLTRLVTTGTLPHVSSKSLAGIKVPAPGTVPQDVIMKAFALEQENWEIIRLSHEKIDRIAKNFGV